MEKKSQELSEALYRIAKKSWCLSWNAWASERELPIIQNRMDAII